MRSRKEIAEELSDTLRMRDGIVREIDRNLGRITIERYKLYVDVQDRILELVEELRQARRAETGREDDT